VKNDYHEKGKRNPANNFHDRVDIGQNVMWFLFCGMVNAWVAERPLKTAGKV
jgi:hypothetical protein